MNGNGGGLARGGGNHDPQWSARRQFHSLVIHDEGVQREREQAFRVPDIVTTHKGGEGVLPRRLSLGRMRRSCAPIDKSPLSPSLSHLGDATVNTYCANILAIRRVTHMRGGEEMRGRGEGGRQNNRYWLTHAQRSRATLCHLRMPGSLRSAGGSAGDV